MDGKKFNQLWGSAKRPLLIVVVGVLLYEFLENFNPVMKALGSVLGVLKPVFIGVAIAFIANMPLRFLETRVFRKWNKKRMNIKRGLCLCLSLLFVLAIISLVFLLIIPKMAESITSLAEGFDSYVASFTAWADGLWNRVNLSVEVESIIRDFAGKILASFSEFLTGLAPAALKFTVSVASFLINVVLAFIISFYALYNKEKLLFQLKKLIVAIFPDKRATRVLEVCSRTNRALNQYFFGMIVECTILGLMTFLMMVIFDFPYAVLISVIVGVTQMVPIIGPWVSGALGVLIILVTDPPKALWFAIAVFTVQQLEANLVYPRVVGSAVGLSGIWVMIAVILGSGFFGITGVVLCVPVMAVLYTLVSEWVNRRVEEKRFAMGMRPEPPTEEEIKAMKD